jgi:hypothetical protein
MMTAMIAWFLLHQSIRRVFFLKRKGKIFSFHRVGFESLAFCGSGCIKRIIFLAFFFIGLFQGSVLFWVSTCQVIGLLTTLLLSRTVQFYWLQATWMATLVINLIFGSSLDLVRDGALI